MRFQVFSGFLSSSSNLTEDRRRLDQFVITREAVALDDVKSWVTSWGTAEELPRPVPRKIG
jgi:hypothetical protein